MDWQDIIALTIVAAAGWWTVRTFRRGIGGCDSCHRSDAPDAAASRRVKVTPLLPTDQVGLPPSSPRHPEREASTAKSAR